MSFPITCTACQKTFTISDEIYEKKVAGRVVTIKCKACGAGIRVDGTKGASASTPALAPTPPAAAPAAPAPAPAAEGLWAVDYPDGQDREFSTPEVVVELERGAVDGATLVWRDGMAEWLELRQVPELATELAKVEAKKSAAAAAAAAAVAATAAAATAAAAAAAAAAAKTTPVHKPRAPMPTVTGLAGLPGAQKPRVQPSPGPGLTQPGAQQPPLGLTQPLAKQASASDLAQPRAKQPSSPLFTQPRAQQPSYPGLTPPRAKQPSASDLTPPRAKQPSASDLTPPRAKQPSASDLTPPFAQQPAAPEIARLKPAQPPTPPTPPTPPPPLAAPTPPPLAAPMPPSLKQTMVGVAPPPPLAAPMPPSLKQTMVGVAPPPPLPDPLLDAIPPLPASVAKVVSRPAQVPPTFPLTSPSPVPAAAFGTGPAMVADHASVEWPEAKSKKPLIIGALLVAAALIGGAVVLLGGQDAPAPSTPVSALPPGPGATPTPPTPTPPTPTAAEGSDTASGSDPVPTAPDQGATPGAGFAELFAAGARKAESKGSSVAPSARFDPVATTAPLAEAATQAQACKQSGGPTGKVTVVVTFAPNGKASSATITDAPFAGTATAACISSALKRAAIPPFSGLPGTVSKTFSIL